jgi:hypothetical protein
MIAAIITRVSSLVENAPLAILLIFLEALKT